MVIRVSVSAYEKAEEAVRAGGGGVADAKRAGGGGWGVGEGPIAEGASAVGGVGGIGGHYSAKRRPWLPERRRRRCHC